MILLQEIAESIILPILPEDANVSIKEMNDSEKSICVDTHTEQEDYGIVSDTKTIKHRHISLTINWTEDYTETEKITNLIYKSISIIENKQYDNFFVRFITMDDNEPIDNKRNKFEYYSKIINFEIYYEKGDK